MNQCFIISPPRAGSTLLQRLLSAHPAIKTVGEPWLALPFAYALRESGVRGEYSHRSMSFGITEFLDGLPNGRESWFREAGAMLARLQEQLATPETVWFLDKTPRYYLILDELARMFPDARFVVLHRNPLAVAASILNTWHEGRFRFGSNEIDIYESPQRIAAFVAQRRANVTEVRYENLVREPATSVRAITDFLGVEPLADVRLPEDDPIKRARLGDKTGINRFSKVSADSVDAWMRSFASPLRKAWARRYLEWIGNGVLNQLGYDANVLHEELRRAPTSFAQSATDLADFNAEILTLIFAPKLEFVSKRRRDGRLSYSWKPRF